MLSKSSHEIPDIPRLHATNGVRVGFGVGIGDGAGVGGIVGEGLGMGVVGDWVVGATDDGTNVGEGLRGAITGDCVSGPNEAVGEATGGTGTLPESGACVGEWSVGITGIKIGANVGNLNSSNVGKSNSSSMGLKGDA